MTLIHPILPSLPYRYFITIQAFITLSVNYTMRHCLKIAMPHITAPIRSSKMNNETLCNYTMYLIVKKSSNKTYEYHWNSVERLIVDSSFYVGYVLSMTPFGILSDAFGPRYFSISSLIGSGIMILIHPSLIKFVGLYGTIIPNFFLGIFQGAGYSSLHTIVAFWIPTNERTTCATFIFCGIYVSSSIKEIASKSIYPEQWSTVFYIFGSFGIIWGTFLFFTMYNTPEDHPSLKLKESLLLEEQTKLLVFLRGSRRYPPFVTIIFNNVIFSIFVAHFGHMWCFVLVIKQMPLFLKYVIHYDIKANVYSSSMTPICVIIVAVTSGYLCDWMINTKKISVTGARKLFFSLSSLVSGLFLIVGSYSNCNRHLSVASAIIGVFFMGFFYSSLKITMIDVFPPFAGFVGGITHTLGSMALLFTGHTVRIMTPNNYWSEWRLVFWIGFGMIVITTVYYIAFGTSEIHNITKEDSQSSISLASENLKLMSKTNTKK